MKRKKLFILVMCLVKYLDNISDEDILNLNIPYGIPLEYELDKWLNLMKNYYLRDKKFFYRKHLLLVIKANQINSAVLVSKLKNTYP